MKMRHSVTCLLVLLAPSLLAAQEDLDVAAPVMETASGYRAQFLPAIPRVDSIGSDWETSFPRGESRQNFKLLREYRAEKQTLLNLERPKLSTLGSIREHVESEFEPRSDAIIILAQLLRTAENDTVRITQSYPFEFDRTVGFTTPGVYPVGALRAAERLVAAQDTANRRTLAKLDSVSARVAANIENLETDFRQAEGALDRALAPEYKSQEFRTATSAFFAGLIAIMIIAFFATIYKKSGDNIGTLLLSDGGLQFVTIFVLIIAIILFGILNILEGRELAAILSGIAGYILGRGAQLKGDASAPDAQQPAAPAAPPAEPQMVRVPGLYIPPAGAVPPDPPPPAPQPPVEPAPAPVPAAAEAPPAGEAPPEGEVPAEKPAPVAVG